MYVSLQEGLYDLCRLRIEKDEEFKAQSARGADFESGNIIALVKRVNSSSATVKLPTTLWISHMTQPSGTPKKPINFNHSFLNSCMRR